MTNMPRPPLPLQCFNQKIKEMKDGQAPAVKFQRINRETKEVLVGRIKVQTPANGHAFILRRFDTGAVSITTLFRAAFPTASEQAERDEISWVAHAYDLTGANGGLEPDRVRFSGRWAGPKIAKMLAEQYGLGAIVPALMDAKAEDANASPAKITAAKGPATPAGKPPVQTATPATSGGPPASKRRKDKESTPEPSPVKRGRIQQQQSPAPAPPTPAPSQLPRRSTRTRATRSPSAPPPASQNTARARSNTPARTSPRKARKPVLGSDETMVGSDAFGNEKNAHSVQPVDEEDEEELEAATRPNYAEDVADQKALIAGLKAARERNVGEADVAMDKMNKRALEEEDPALRFNFKEPEVEERALVANSRVRSGGRIANLAPQQKSALWGSLAFAVGLGATVILPNLFSL